MKQVYLRRLRHLIFKGNQQIDSAYDQSDDPLDGLSKGWRSILELDYTFRKDDNGKMLRCVANHEALTEKTLEAKAMLNVQCKTIFFFKFIV